MGCGARLNENYGSQVYNSLNLGCPLDVFRVLRNLKKAEVRISTRTTG